MTYALPYTGRTCSSTDATPTPMPEIFHRDWVGVFPKDLPGPVDEEGVRPHTTTSKGKIMKATYGIAAVVLAASSFLAGTAVKSGSTTVVDRPVPGPTTTETVKVNLVPEACKTAMDDADAMDAAEYAAILYLGEVMKAASSLDSVKMKELTPDSRAKGAAVKTAREKYQASSASCRSAK